MFMESKPPVGHPATDQIVLLIVGGLDAEALKVACVKTLGVKPQAVAHVLKEARRRITRAADYNRDEQLGTAITRLNDLFARAIREGDLKTSLTAQREIDKLLGLYAAASERTWTESGSESEQDESGDTGQRGELGAIRRHLLPLGLASDEYPLHEHARIAADLIREHRQCPSQ